MKSYEDCTCIQKGALAVFKEEFFNKKIVRPLLLFSFVVIVLSIIVLRFFASPHLLMQEITTVALECFIFFFIIQYKYNFYAERAIKSRFYKKRWAQLKIEEYENFIKLYEIEKKEYEKSKNHAVRFLACLEVPLRN